MERGRRDGEGKEGWRGEGGMERGRRDGEGREGWRVMEGRGSDGGGNGGAGPSLSTVGVRHLGVGVVVGHVRSSFVGGRSLLLWAVGLVLGGWRCSWGLGSCLWAPSCRFWAVGLVRVRYTFVGGGLLLVGGLFVDAGLSFVGVVVLCRVSCGHR
jgi:hypothetical protein